MAANHVTQTRNQRTVGKKNCTAQWGRRLRRSSEARSQHDRNNSREKTHRSTLLLRGEVQLGTQVGTHSCTPKLLQSPIPSQLKHLFCIHSEMSKVGTARRTGEVVRTEGRRKEREDDPLVVLTGTHSVLFQDVDAASIALAAKLQAEEDAALAQRLGQRSYHLISSD
jgi:hypothetical protein